MARVIDAEITPASLTRLKLPRSRESNNYSWISIRPRPREKMKEIEFINAAKTSNPVTQEQPESRLSHTLYLCSIESPSYKYICICMLIVQSLKGKK